MSTREERKKEHIEWLRRSKEQIGAKNRVLMTRDGIVIDGKHRLEADSTWPVETVDKSRKEALIERIHRNIHRKVPMRERKAQIMELALYLEDEGIKKEDMIQALRKEIPFSEDYIRRLLPAKYKRAYTKPKKLKLEIGTQSQIETHPKIVTGPGVTRKLDLMSQPPSIVGFEPTVPEPSEEKPDIETDIAVGKVSDRVKWILNNSAMDINYRMNIPRLTDAELEYCLKHETRVSGRKHLEREFKRRRKKFPILERPSKPAKPKLPSTFKCPECHTEQKAFICPKCFRDIKVKTIAKTIIASMKETQR